MATTKGTPTTTRAEAITMIMRTLMAMRDHEQKFLDKFRGDIAAGYSINQQLEWAGTTAEAEFKTAEYEKVLYEREDEANFMQRLDSSINRLSRDLLGNFDSSISTSLFSNAVNHHKREAKAYVYRRLVEAQIFIYNQEA